MQVVDFFSSNQNNNSPNNESLSSSSSVKVVGVDISKNRMEKCKSAIVDKYLIDHKTSGSIKISPDRINVQLYLQDGTTFGMKETSSDYDSLVFDSRVATDEALKSWETKTNE